MKKLQIQQALLKKGYLLLLLLFSVWLLPACRKIYQNPSPKVKTIVTGLQSPMGIEIDGRGDILVAESGTAHNDGKIVLVRPEKGGAKTWDVVVNLSSIMNAIAPEVEGPAHMLLDHGTLYVLAGDFLYSIDVKNYKPRDMPIDGSKLPYEDIGSWVRSQNIVHPNDSHPYNLVNGPDGKLYITDAGANAIIRRNGKGNYSVLATFQGFKNPTPLPFDSIQMVPTGIVFDGHHFLVSTLTGFPFLPGKAVIYKVSLSGEVSIYTGGQSTLVDLAPGNFYGHVALSYGSFDKGWKPNTGSLFFITPHASREIAGGLNLPSAVKQAGGQTWYVSSMGDGSLLKVTYDY